MVHGNPTWSFYWRRLIRAFCDRFRAVVPDHLGCGLSDKPQQYPYCLQTHIDNLVSLIDQLDLQQVTLLGHDWGGPIGLGAALTRPERFWRFVLFNTGAFPPPYIPWRIRICRMPLLGCMAVHGLNLFSRAALRMAVADRHRFRTRPARGCSRPATVAAVASPSGVLCGYPEIAASSDLANVARIEAGLPGLASSPSS